MRTVAMLAVLMLAVGCQEETAEQAIHVGMPLDQAKEIMAKAGAEEGIFFSMMPEEPPGGPKPVVTDFLFRDGPGLFVVAEPTGESGALVIKHISICDNPEGPKFHQEWRTVETFTP